MNDGLEDVVAAETVLSDVDGLAGRLVIRGLPLAALAGRVSYEHVLGLLWDGFFDDLHKLVCRADPWCRLYINAAHDLTEEQKEEQPRGDPSHRGNGARARPAIRIGH